MQALSLQDTVDQHLLRLRDGRRLAYCSTGPPEGTLVVYLHGAIGSPQEACAELDRAVQELGVHYVMLSRPGFGDSDPHSGRTLLDLAGDVAQLADHLGRERFAVVGVSAGGPYALACAHELPERVAAAAVVSSMAPACSPDVAPGVPSTLRCGLRLLRRRPRGCSWSADALLAIARRHPGIVTRAMMAGAPPADRTLLGEREARELAAGRFLGAARGGVAGMIDDYVLCTGPWGFAPQDVRGLVHVWHGVQDQIVPVDQALHMAAMLPRVQTALHPDEGHFFYRRRLREILGDLTAAVGSAACRSPVPERHRAVPAHGPAPPAPRDPRAVGQPRGRVPEARLAP
ncbi:MAG: alpha/beta fold hydrolase [Solirubrobacteraceae bacterium]